jgi:hypothetical protein
MLFLPRIKFFMLAHRLQHLSSSALSSLKMPFKAIGPDNYIKVRNKGNGGDSQCFPLNFFAD